MTDLHIKRHDVKEEYEALISAMSSIRELAISADHTQGISTLSAIQAIKTISTQNMRCTPLLDEIFYGDED